MRDVRSKKMNNIYRNFAWCNEYTEESFVGQLHENKTWNDDEYFKLEGTLYELCSEYKDAQCIPRDLAWPIVRIFSYLMLTLGCQYDSNDAYEIENISREQFYDRRERIQLIFEGFFTGEMPDKEFLGY